MPGVRAAVLRRYESYDKAWHRWDLGEGCPWCVQVTALKAGRPAEFQGTSIWGAVVNAGRDDRTLRDLMHSRDWFAVVGPDTIEAVE